VIASGSLSGMSDIFLAIPIAAIFGGLTYVFLLYELEDRNGRIILLLAFALSVVTAFYMSLEVTPIYEETLGSIDISNMDAQVVQELSSSFTQEISKISAYGVFGNILMLFAMYMAYNRVSLEKIVDLS